MGRNANLPHDRAKGSESMCRQRLARLGCTDSWVYKLVAFRIGNRKGLQVTVSRIEVYLASRKVEPE